MSQKLANYEAALPSSANPGKAPGAHSLAEILSQPKTWTTCLESMQESAAMKKFPAETSFKPQEYLLIGCGSSYYLGLSAAATMSGFAGFRARAVPASEVLLFPELTLSPNCVPILISRSGQTSEVLDAARLLKARGIPFFAITCATGQALEKLATSALVLAAADEESTVMTRSFTSMLLALQAGAATLANDANYSAELRQMYGDAEAALSPLPKIIQDFVNAHSYADYVYLGQGPFYGLACEGALKITEMSVSYAQPFHTLEFRHGPKSIVAKNTLLIFFLSERGYEAEREVLEEMKFLGATTMVICNTLDDRVRAAADLVVELKLKSAERYRLAPYLIPAQLLGLYTGLKKGHDPDSPRHLSRVVILDQKSAAKESRHASL